MLEAEEYTKLVNRYGPIFSTEIKNQKVYFREITFAEFDSIINIQNMEGGSSLDSEDLIIQAAVVYPKNLNIDRLPAGVVASLSQEILNVSGFNNPKTAKRILEEKRYAAAQVRGLMKAFVLSTIKSYTPEELDQMTYSQLAEKVALSEKIIEITQAMHAVEPNDLKLQLIDPEEEEQKKQQKAAKHNMAKAEGAANYNDPIAQQLWGMKR